MFRKRQPQIRATASGGISIANRNQVIGLPCRMIRDELVHVRRDNDEILLEVENHDIRFPAEDEHMAIRDVQRAIVRSRGHARAGRWPGFVLGLFAGGLLAILIAFAVTGATSDAPSGVAPPPSLINPGFAPEEPMGSIRGTEDGSDGDPWRCLEVD